MKKKILLVSFMVIILMFLLLVGCENKTPQNTNVVSDTGTDSNVTDTPTDNTTIDPGTGTNTPSDPGSNNQQVQPNTNNSDPVTYTRPVYMGMEIEKVAGPQNAFLDNLVDYTYTDVDKLDDYLTDGEESFILNINIENPDELIILLVTLQNLITEEEKSYPMYSFEYGSDLENIKVRVDVPSEANIPSDHILKYKITKIVYIEKTEIKQEDLNKTDGPTVDMKSKGKKDTIDIGIMYSNLPEAQVIPNISFTSAEMSISIFDSNGLIGDNAIMFYCSDGVDIVYEEELDVKANQIVNITGLLQNKTYHYGIITAYDYYDGKETESHWLAEGTFKTTDIFGFNNVTKDYTSITFGVTGNITEDNQITKISLVDLDYANSDILEIDDFSDITSLQFTNLKSGRNYKIIVDYTYVTNNETEGSQVEYITWTNYKQKPTITIDCDTELMNDGYIKVTFTRNKTDDHGGTFISYRSLQILLNNEVITERTLALSIGAAWASGLSGYACNKNYQVKVGYEYDLNDGNGGQIDYVYSTFIYEYDIYDNINNNFYDATSVIIPYGITELPVDTFQDMNSLESVLLPEGLETISYNAFLGCSSLTTVNIPSTLITIGNNAFYGCENLSSIVIPGSVTSIGNYAFYNCYNLSSITLSDGLISIGNYAFGQCNGLTSIAIPNSVTTIGSDAFNALLTEVILPESLINYELMFSNVMRVENVVIPAAITSFTMKIANSIKSDKFVNFYYNGNIEQWNAIDFGECGNFSEYLYEWIPITPREKICSIYVLDEDGLIEYKGQKYSEITE